MSFKIVPFVLLAGMATASSAHAYETRVRWVEIIGTTQIELYNDFVDADVFPTRLRFQIGVFDDASGPAPTGGVLGWNMGSLEIEISDPSKSYDRRTPGRLSPFNSSTDPNANGNPPLPGGDPFELLTDIDATLGNQTRAWGFDDRGDPLPRPGALIRGRNTFVSIYEITVHPLRVGGHYFLHAGGNVVAVTDWEIFGDPIPPDPDDMTPGSVTYAPVVGESSPFNYSLWVYAGPAPGTAPPMLIGALIAMRRRRS